MAFFMPIIGFVLGLVLLRHRPRSISRSRCWGVPSDKSASVVNGAGANPGANLRTTKSNSEQLDEVSPVANSHEPGDSENS